jgi:hypothetical protein
MEPSELATLIEQQAALTVTVATGGLRIEERQQEYKPAAGRFREGLRRFGLENPNPYEDCGRGTGTGRSTCRRTRLAGHMSESSTSRCLTRSSILPSEPSAPISSYWRRDGSEPRPRE